MCVAYPGRVLEVNNNRAKVDFSGSIMDVNVSVVDVKPDDYVLVHAGMAIQKVATAEAESWIDLFKEIEEAGREGLAHAFNDKEEESLEAVDTHKADLKEKPNTDAVINAEVMADSMQNFSEK